MSIWNNFDSSLETQATIESVTETDNVVIERVTLSGRETGEGRVKIAAAFAYDALSPALETVLIFPDSAETINEDILRLFVKRGFSALMVDYRGQWDGCDFHTVYPKNVEYANTVLCGRRKDYVDDSADKTVWYEWAGVGIYACKYITERTGVSNVAVVGIRDGGEIAWKLAVACKLACIIPVCAAGWKAYANISKYVSEEPQLDEERYRFIAGIDSQAYAPYVKCPVLMLCSTNDVRFDYDRAYDTFSRINPDFISSSAIAYSVRCNSSIGLKSVSDMFLFLDRCLKNRQVFIPAPAEVSVEVDEDSNLVAIAKFDEQGVVENCRMYLSEDSIDSTLRDWQVCPLKSKKSEHEREFYLNIYEKTSTIFVMCHAKYTNGFTVWSKMSVKKISGSFRNMQSKCRVIYSNKNGTDGFSVANPKQHATAGIFIAEGENLPRLVSKAKNIKGLYSPCGLTTFRMNTLRFSPSDGSVLSIDLFTDTTSKVNLMLTDLNSGEEYTAVIDIIGGVWQSFVNESKSFKTASGAPLPEFTANMKFTVTCPVPFAVNNLMWL